MPTDQNKPATFVIRGGRVIDPARDLDRITDLSIVDGRIESVGAQSKPAIPIVDADGLIVCPGLIDLHVHLREPGGEHKETIRTGTRAAAAGGFTAVACMPNTSPPIDNLETLELVRNLARERAACRVYPVAAISRARGGADLVNMRALQDAGAVAFSDDGDGVDDHSVMELALKTVREIDALLIQHCQFKSMSAGGVMHEGDVSRRLGLTGIDPAAEEDMIERDIALARKTGARYHVAHISTARAVQLVRRAKARRLPVTAEVCTHHLMLTHQACEDQDPNTKMQPPLRTDADVEACRVGLRDGTIDCIVTDHAPHAEQEKARGFLHAPFGIVGLETALPIAAAAMGQPDPANLDWTALIRWMSTAPAAILRRPGGTLATGAHADITLIDPHTPWRIDPRRFRSKSSNTPFAGRKVNTRPVATFLDGRLTHHLESQSYRLATILDSIN